MSVAVLFVQRILARASSPLKTRPRSLPDPRRTSAWLFLFSLGALLLGAGPLDADERIRFRTYDIADGLSGEPVLSVLQDHLGYLWVGSFGGLDRFDGYRFESFTPAADRPGSLPGKEVAALLEDHMGRLWVGTDQGPALFDRAHRSFRLLRIDSERSDSDGDGLQVNVFFQDRDKVLWIGTEDGIFRLPLSASEPRQDQIRQGFEGLLPGSPELPDPRVYGIAQDRDGNIWIGGRGGLSRLARQAGRPRLDHFRYAADDPESLHDDEVYALELDRDGDLWIGTWGGGGLGRLPADQLSDSEPRFQRFTYPAGDPRGVPGEVVKTLFQDRDGTLWMGTQTKGLCRLTEAERVRPEPHIFCLTHDPLDSTSVPRSTFFDLTQDDQGTIWAAAYHGLGHHVPQTAAVALIHPQPEPGASPGSINVGSLAESPDGTVWVSTREGLERVRLQPEDGSLQVERFLPDERNPDSLSAPWIFHLETDRQGRLWVGTVLGGLQRLISDPQETPPRFRTYGAESGLTIRSIFSIYQDRRQRLWAGSYNGLFFSDLKSDGEPAGFQLWKPESSQESLSSGLVYTLVDDDQGRLWVGTDKGLDRISADRSTVENDLIEPGMIAHQLLAADDGMIWLTGTAGLLQIDPSTDQVRRWGKAEGLDGDLLSLSFDSLGRVWVGAKRRLYRLDPRTNELRGFGSRDGFLNLPFREQALLGASDGHFYLGGTNGLAVFRPEALRQDPLLVPVVLRGLQLASGPVEVAPGGLLPRSIESLDTLVLPPGEPLFSIDFAALTFHRQDAIRYAYRLRGYSDEWIESGSEARRATFTNLSPGDYTFEVRARTDVGDWGIQPARLKIGVEPRWYETSAALAGALLLGLGLPAFWVRLRFRRLEKRRRELQDLVDRWQIERDERRRWQDLTVTAARLGQEARRPLEGVRRLARDLASSDALHGEARDTAGHILARSQTVDRRLGELLSFLLLRRPEVKPVHLKSLIATVLGELEPELKAAGVSAVEEVGGTYVLADPELLEQMLIHVIRSRLDATESGLQPVCELRFTLDVESADDAAGDEQKQARLRILAIRDVSTDHPDRTLATTVDGLGLSLAEHLAEQQDWSMDVETGDGSQTRIDVKGMRLVS